MKERWPNPVERFMQYVEYDTNGGCWLWSYKTWRSGYGRFRLGFKYVAAHRFAYRQFKSDPGSLNVLHRCDNPLCVNPDHLFAGTQRDNVRDMHSKGRGGGHGRGARRLTQTEIEHIIANRDQSKHALSRELGISRGTIAGVLERHHA